MKSPIPDKWYKKGRRVDGTRDNLHKLIVEESLGYTLPKGSEIHHVDGDKHNNEKTNLVVCPSRSYHKLLHKRQRVIDAGYNPNTHRYCSDCNSFKENSLFYKNKLKCDGLSNNCKSCSDHRRKLNDRLTNKRMDRC